MEGEILHNHAPVPIRTGLEKSAMQGSRRKPFQKVELLKSRGPDNVFPNFS